MSAPFNPNDFNQNGSTQDILNMVADNYLRNNGITNSTATTNFLSTVNLTSDTNISGNIIVNGSTLTPIELSYIDGASSNIQTQINNISGGGNALLTTNNTWSGTQTWNNNFIVNGSTLTPTELSYIDGSTSNIQTQLTTNSNNTGNINTILTNNGITNSTNVINSIDYLQSQITNLPNNGSGSGQSYFLTSTTSTINNQYKTISIIPANSTNQILTSGVITNASAPALMGQFISDPLNITSIPAGIYDFNMYASLTNNNLSSYLVVELYKYSSTGTTTLLFTVNGSDINSQIIIPYNINLTAVEQSLLVTDSIMIRIYGITTSSQNVTINIDYNSSNNYSHFHIPVIQRIAHNSLLSIQGGATNDYQHLTTTQLNNINNPSTISNNGYLLNTDFSIFNNKEPAINKNTAFNKNYETSTSNIKMNNTVSVGSLDTIARSDHIHPVDTSREPLITAGTTSQYFRGDKSFQTLDKSTVGLSNVVNKDFTQNRNNIIYVDGYSGNDSNNGLSLLTAYKSISSALSNSLVSSGVQIVIYPSTYSENITINANNISIVATNNEIGGIINISGDITITSSNTSIRLCSLTFNSITISGVNSNVYIKDCNINGSLTKSGSGFLSMNNVVCNTSTQVSITGAGNFNASNCSFGVNMTINNASSKVNISNCLLMANLIVTLGIVSINNTVIYATDSTVYAVNTTNDAILYLSNLSCVNANNNSIAKLNILGFYSITNVNYNRTTSILTGGNLSRISYFDAINVGGGNIVDTSSIQTVSNKQMNSMTLGTNAMLSTTGKLITFLDAVATIVNTTSVQTLDNKFINAGSLVNGCVCPTENLNNADGRLANCQFVQNALTTGTATMSNKTLTSPIINNGTISGAAITNGTINLALIGGDNVGVTQLSTDNSTKLATTAFVKQFSAYTVFKNTNVTTSPYVFNFGTGGYLEFYIDTGSVYIRTKTTYLSSVQISYSAPYCYSVAGTFFGQATTSTLLGAGANNFLVSQAAIIATPNGRSISFFLLDVTNDYLYRGYVQCIKYDSPIRICYFVEQLQ